MSSIQTEVIQKHDPASQNRIQALQLDRPIQAPMSRKFDRASLNRLRAVRFDRPEYIPLDWTINDACWHHYPQEQLEELMATHPLLFPEYKPLPNNYQPSYPLWSRKEEPYVDDWGCRWETTDDGIVGSVTQHPLADWSDFDSYLPPDPNSSNGRWREDSDSLAKQIEMQARKRKLICAGLPHGHTFLLLTDIRGYENVIFDMIDHDPRLPVLLEMIEQFNTAYIRRVIAAGAQWIAYPEDLGMQHGPMLSPDLFREYIKPVYQRMMALAREAGCIVHMHSDGDIRTLAEDLLEDGVDVLNLQDQVNGVDWIRDNLKGKVCIDLDIDRQKITSRGTPKEIDAMIRREVEALGSREGGLILGYGLYPHMPFENALAVADAMERYATYYA